MEKLTAIITTHNEEHNIEEVLRSVSFANEIIVVDSFSTDRTAELARKHTNRVVQHEYLYPAAQKNWIIPQASNEWILLLDADECVSEDLREEIQETLSRPPTLDAYWIPRQNYFMGRKVNYSGWQGDKVIRLFKKTCRYRDVKVHEEIEIAGKAGFLKSKLDHFTYVSLAHYLEKMERYSTWGAQDRLHRTKKITAYHLVVKPSWTFFHKYFIRLGFLDGKVGFIIAKISAYYTFLRAVKIWRMKQEEKF